MRRKISESFLGICEYKCMKSTEREKLCVSCDGRIPWDAEVCLFCASKQSGAGMQNSFQAPLFQHQSLEDSLASLYTPPYQGKRPQFALNPSLEKQPQQPQQPSLYKSVTEKPEMNPLLGVVAGGEEEAEAKGGLWPMVLLLGGAHLSLLGLMQLFFSKNGFLRLEWNANYWFLYCLLGVPLLYFGYKKVKKIN